MRISRRDFVHAGCAALSASFALSPVDKAKAFLLQGGVTQPTFNANRVTINVDYSTGYMNLAKSWSPSFPNYLSPLITDVNGYPNNTTLGSGVSGNIPFIPNSYAQYSHSWTGTGAMAWSVFSAIIYSGGTFCGLGSSSGSVTGNLTISGTNPTVVFKWGALVTAISGGNGSLVTITTASLAFGGGVPTGVSVKFGVGCSSNLSNGPNADGSWTITNNVSGTQFTLNGSTGVVSPTITTGGVVGTNTEAVFNPGTAGSLAYNAAAFSGFTNLVICLASNATAIASGQIYDPVLVAQFQQLRGTPSGVGRSGDMWLRFMDASAGGVSFECDFSQRLTVNSQCWVNGSGIVQGYQAGTITNGGASGSFTDLFSCASNPSNSPASGPPIDCEVIQGTISATNSGGLPGLTVAGRSGFGNWPILGNGIEPVILNATAPASAGLTLHFTFSATWLNGGVAYSGFSYTTVSGDVGSLSTFQVNLQTALMADAVLAAGKIVFTRDGLSGTVYLIPPTALSGVLTVTYTSGPAIMTVCTLLPSTITSGTTGTFSFNALLGGFLYLGTGFLRSIPCEAIAELCNRVGANCWDNWPVYTKGSYITARTAFMASGTTGLTSGLKYGGEFGNELWNFGAVAWGRVQCFGITLGLFSFPYGGDEGPYGYGGLRTVQYASLSRAAWASAGRSAGQHYILSMSAEFDAAVNSNFDLYFLKGQFLVTSNANFANFGGVGGTAQATSLNAYPNRPADISDAIGLAPYWGSRWFSLNSSGVNGTVAQNAPMLQASFDFASGNTTTAFTELTNQFNGTTPRSSGGSGIALNPDYASVFVSEEAQAAQYDASGRAVPLKIMHYEGGPQWASGNNGVNGVNTASSKAAAISTADLNALVNQITNVLGWTTTSLIPYTVSGTGNITEVATNILQMSQGWKYDTDHNGAAANTGSYSAFIQTSYYQALVAVSGAKRETHPSQFGYAGDQWGLFWNTYDQLEPAYQNYNAIAAFNA